MKLLLENLIKEGYKEVDELSKLADLIINKVAGVNLDNINKIASKDLKNLTSDQLELTSIDIDYDILSEDRNLISKFTVIKDFLQRILTYVKHDITIKIYITSKNLGVYSKSKSNPYIYILINKNEIHPILKEFYDRYGKINKNMSIFLLNNFIKSTLIHELQHAFDDYKSNGKYDTDKQSKSYYKKQKELEDLKYKNKNKPKELINILIDDDAEATTEYLKLPHEYWARLTQYISDKNIDFFKNNTIHNVVNDMKKSYLIAYNELDEKQKRILIKAITKYWYIYNSKEKK